MRQALLSIVLLAASSTAFAGPNGGASNYNVPPTNMTGQVVTIGQLQFSPGGSTIAANGTLSISTAASAALTVLPDIYIHTNGSVGIQEKNTTSDVLGVYGNFSFGDDNGADNLAINHTAIITRPGASTEVDFLANIYWQSLKLMTNNTAALTINSSQFVGIGPASASTKLHVSSGVLTVDGTSPGIYVGGAGAITSNFILQTSTGTSLNVNNAGQVAIGDTLMVGLEHVASGFWTLDGAGSAMDIRGPAFTFGTCGSAGGTFTTAGTAGAGTITAGNSGTTCAITWSPACKNGSIVDWLNMTHSSDTISSIAAGVASSTITYVAGMTKNDVHQVHVICR